MPKPAEAVPAAAPPAAAALAAYDALTRAARAIEARLEPAIVAAGLTPTQFHALRALARHGPMTQTGLGRALRTSRSNLTDLLGKLEQRGLIRRRHRPGDRRAVWVAPTEAGQARIAALLPDHEAAIVAAMAGLDAARLRGLAALLARLGADEAGPAPDAGEPSARPGPLAGDSGAAQLRGAACDPACSDP